MRSLKFRFEESGNKQRRGCSTYIIFANAVKGGRFSRDIIRCWFNRLVEKDDYSPSDKRSLLRQLYELSNPPVDVQDRH